MLKTEGVMLSVFFFYLLQTLINTDISAEEIKRVKFFLNLLK